MVDRQLEKDREKTLQKILSLLIEDGLNGTQVARRIDRPNLYVLGFLDGLVASQILNVKKVGKSNVFQVKEPKKVRESIELAD
ncbi:MAG: hypothetical protein ACTSUV_02485 [Candidatus Ranarchaeia archaeon]